MEERVRGGRKRESERRKSGKERESWTLLVL